MIEIGASEAEGVLGTLLDRVEAGEEVLITRGGRPIARFVAAPGAVDRGEAAAAAERIRVRSAEVTSKFRWADVKQERDLGRP